MHHLCLEWKVAYPQIHFKRHFYIYTGEPEVKIRNIRKLSDIFQNPGSIKNTTRREANHYTYDCLLHRWENMYFCLSHCIYAVLYPTFLTYFFYLVLQPYQRKPIFLGAHLLLRALLFVPELSSGICHIPQQPLFCGNSTHTILPCTMAYSH